MRIDSVELIESKETVRESGLQARSPLTSWLIAGALRQAGRTDWRKTPGFLPRIQSKPELNPRA
jgi:hypothetical protein